MAAWLLLSYSPFPVQHLIRLPCIYVTKYSKYSLYGKWCKQLEVL